MHEYYFWIIDACERRHGTSRLQLRGLQVENYMFPTACRHCADPACLLCSVNGIVRLPSGEIQIVEESCIGWEACFEACPVLIDSVPASLMKLT